MKAIKHLNENKAQGTREDGSTAEQLKALNKESLKIVTEVPNEIYTTGVIPKDLKQSVFIKISK